MQTLSKAPGRVGPLAAGLLAGIVVISAIASSRSSSAAPADNAAAQQGDVKALYREKCSACHNLPVPEEKGYTRDLWQQVVNRMVTKYKAPVTPDEATRIVNYLGTFAPGATPTRPSDTRTSDSVDVWPSAPTATHVFTFADAGLLLGLTPVISGGKAPKATWKDVDDATAPDGHIVHVKPATANPDRFAILLATDYSGRNIDTKASFRITGGKASPSVGIVVGYQDAAHYDVIRYHDKSRYVALTQIRGDVHTTLRKADVPPAAEGDKPSSWHVLRVQARDGRIRAWLDMTPLISVDEPDYAAGKAGLWVQGDTSADFDDWSVDVYDAPAAQ